MNKYHAQKITVDGQTFDSKKEYGRWCELKLLERAGKISGLRRQVCFELIPAQYETVERYGKTGRLPDGKKCVEHAVNYVADFVYTENGKMVVEDVKGCKARNAYYIYSLKRKMMRYIKGIVVREI